MSGRDRPRLFTSSSVLDVVFWLSGAIVVICVAVLAFQRFGPALGIPALLLPIGFVAFTVRYVRRPVQPDDPRRPWWWQ